MGRPALARPAPWWRSSDRSWDPRARCSSPPRVTPPWTTWPRDWTAVEWTSSGQCVSNDGQYPDCVLGSVIPPKWLRKSSIGHWITSCAMSLQFLETSSTKQPRQHTAALILRVNLEISEILFQQYWHFLELQYQAKKQEAKLGRLINEQLVKAAVVFGTFMNCSDCKSANEKLTFLQAKYLQLVPCNIFLGVSLLWPWLMSVPRPRRPQFGFWSPEPKSSYWRETTTSCLQLCTIE